MASITPLTARHASDQLATVGILVKRENIDLQARVDRWCAFLPGHRMAWFAASDAAQCQMVVERRVLQVLATRCSFTAPRILHEAADGSFDVRDMVPGMHDSFAVLARVRDRPQTAALIGTTLGAMLGDLHTRVAADDIAADLPHRPTWPEPRAWIRERLPFVVDDPALHRAADRVIAQYEDTVSDIPNTDRVLVHTDLGLHNLSIDPETLVVLGIFDWEAACWADRHLDFRDLVLDVDRFDLLDAALAAYEPVTGVNISRARVFLYHAASAITFLAFRLGIAPETNWCGRTQSEDIAWTRAAIARVQSY